MIENRAFITGAEGKFTPLVKTLGGEEGDDYEDYEEDDEYGLQEEEEEEEDNCHDDDDLDSEYIEEEGDIEVFNN